MGRLPPKGVDRHRCKRYIRNMTKMIRVGDSAHRDLKSEAAIQGTSMEALLDKIIREYKDKKMAARSKRERREEQRSA